MKIKWNNHSADSTIARLDDVLRKLGTGTVSKKKTIRIDESLCNSDKVGIVRMQRTEFGVLITSVSESFENMTGVPRSALEGKYLHHITGGNREDDLAFCDRIDRDGAATKLQPFNGINLRGFILKEEDGIYTELLSKE